MGALWLHPVLEHDDVPDGIGDAAAAQGVVEPPFELVFDRRVAVRLWWGRTRALDLSSQPDLALDFLVGSIEVGSEDLARLVPMSSAVCRLKQEGHTSREIAHNHRALQSNSSGRSAGPGQLAIPHATTRVVVIQKYRASLARHWVCDGMAVRAIVLAMEP